MSSSDADAAVSAFEPRRLTLARLRNGWTKQKLAEVIGVSPAAVTQYELGRARPSGASLSKLASYLGLPARYFAAGRPLVDVNPADAHFRSLRSTRVAERQQALASLAHMAEVVMVLSRLVRLPEVGLLDFRDDEQLTVSETPNDLSTQVELLFEAESDDSPERAARALRRAWRLGRGPLPHLVRQAEMHGIVVAVARFGSSERIDAFSWWPDRLDRPIVCLTSDRGNVLRRRFSAAHEIGHLVLHRHIPRPGSTQHERQADRFAAEFLMPTADILPMLPGRLDLAQLVELQQQWGVSIQALLRRCSVLGTISPHTYKRGMSAVTQLGWRRDEPTLDYEGEWPAMLAEALRLANARGLTEQVLSEGLCLPATELRDLLGIYEESRPQLRLVTP